MLAITRINEIKELICQQKSVLVSELAPRFNVTEETIRRDLKKLEDEGIATRVYGGAYSIGGVQNDVNVTLRETILVDEKKYIAKQCLQFISSGDSIFLDSSTTTLQLATMLSQHSLTVITNSLKVANALAPHHDIRLVVIGGALHVTSMSFLGQSATAALSNYYVDKAFVSSRSLSMKNGITDSNEDQSAIRKIAIHRCDKAFLLADHTKFDQTSFSKVGEFADVSTVVTNRPLSSEWSKYLLSHNISYLDGTK